MAKTKKKISEAVNNKKAEKNAKKPMNPFEVHINKQKYEVLGRKLKNDRGLPGVARAKALKKRKHTLLQEYSVQNKSNKFVDRRIGERNYSMTEEDRKMARFTAVRMKHHNKKSIFNLADDEVLTHRGQTLSEIEKFDDPRSDDDDEDETGRKSSGKLDDSFVGDAHFGGGILKKTGKDGAMSHKDLIEQLIFESKKRKAEKQKTREQTLELTEKLDSEWKDLLPLVSKSKKGPEDPIERHQKPDDYDKVMRELRFEARGVPSDRLKTEDEIAKEEKEKLEKLEKERLDRMKGFIDNSPQTVKHRSADDLDDNFAYDSDPDVTLAYDDEGKCRTLENTPNEAKEDENEEKEEEDEAEDEEVEDSSDAETASEDDLSDLKQDDSDSENDAEQIETNDEIKSNLKKQENESESEKEIMESNDEIPAVIEKKSTTPSKLNNLQDTSLKSDVIKNDKKRKNEVDELNTNVKIAKIKTVEENEKKRKIQEDEQNTHGKIAKTDTEESETKSASVEEVKNDLLARKEIMEKARKELPYTYSLPDSYEKLQFLLVSQPPEYQNIIVERMIKCNHPSLAAENKENLARLFVYLLQHLNDVATENDSIENVKLSFSVLNSLTPQLYELAQQNPDNARNSLIEVIKEKQLEYQKKHRVYPGIDVLLFLKLISCLFSTSDYRHQVVTPSFVFIGQMLTNCKVKTRYDISYGLFLVTLFLEYTALSKRYLPAAIIYLLGILHMTIPKLGVKLVKIIPPFKSNSTALVLVEKYSDSNLNLQMNVEDFLHTDITEKFKVRTFYTVLKLTEEFHENWKQLSAYVEIFEPILKFLEIIPKNNYPIEVQTQMEKIKNLILDAVKNRNTEFIVLEKKKPKALRLYEPNIEKVFDYKKYKPMSREKAEREKLLHKYKKEMKGALREIRRDKSFLARHKIKQRLQSDHERQEKVKQIYSEASIQQGELNALDRKKKRK